MSEFKPTQEQQNILDTAQKVNNLKVVARAGTGKSSTIKLLSDVLPQKSLYLVFNKALKEDAQGRFGSHVECRTMHSLAYSEAATPIKHKLKGAVGHDRVYINRLRTMNELVKGLKIKPLGDMSEQRIASLLMSAMKRWEYSSDMEITESVLPMKDVKDAADKWEINTSVLQKRLLTLLKSWWEQRTDPRRPAIAEHNTYVKIWQLSKPVLPYDIIYLDEAQDLFNVFFDIIQRQTCKIVVVGDDKQAIYQWNGAINALDKFVGYSTLPLTQSFRYGQPIADVAVKVFPEKVQLAGNPNTQSRVGYVDRNLPYTAVYRTNGKLIQDAVDAIGEGRSVAIEIEVRAFREKLQAILDFLRHVKVKHPEVSIFNSIAEMTKEAEEDSELKRMINMCRSGAATTVLNILDTYKKPKNPDITFCTAHKSKGREWSQVVLADDFPDFEDELPVAEQNLLYVAATRAINVLEINSTLNKLITKRNANEPPK